MEIKLKKVKELPDSVMPVRERWSVAVLETVRSTPGVAYEVCSGPRKLIMSRAGYLKQNCKDLTVRVIPGKNGATLYVQANGKV